MLPGFSPELQEHIARRILTALNGCMAMSLKCSLCCLTGPSPQDGEGMRWLSPRRLYVSRMANFAVQHLPRLKNWLHAVLQITPGCGFTQPPFRSPLSSTEKQCVVWC